MHKQLRPRAIPSPWSGGGQAVFRSAWYLANSGIDHVVLKKRVRAGLGAERWTRSVWCAELACQLPGFSISGPDPHGFMLRDGSSSISTTSSPRQSSAARRGHGAQCAQRCAARIHARRDGWVHVAIRWSSPRRLSIPSSALRRAAPSRHRADSISPPQS